MPSSVVQALDTAVSADAALEVASMCLSTAAFVVSAVYLHKYGYEQCLTHKLAVSDNFVPQAEQGCLER